MMADIGVEQIDRLASQDLDFDETRQWSEQAFERCDLRVCKARALPRGPGHHMHGTVAEEQGGCQIISDALGLQILEYGKVDRAIRTDEQATNGAAGHIDGRNGTLAKLLDGDKFEFSRPDIHLLARAP